MKFEYFSTLKDGYRPVMELTEETDVRFVVEASCRVNADRMVKAILKDCTNIQDISGVCIEE